MGNPVVFFELGCRNLEQTADFYQAAFDWTITDNGPLQRKIDTGAGEGVSGMITALGHEPHQYVMCYVQTEDIQVSITKLVELFLI